MVRSHHVDHQRREVIRPAAGAEGGVDETLGNRRRALMGSSLEVLSELAVEEPLRQPV